MTVRTWRQHNMPVVKIRSVRVTRLRNPCSSGQMRGTPICMVAHGGAGRARTAALQSIH